MKETPLLAAIWDVDGTLVDTAELHFRAWTQLIPTLGRPFTREDFRHTFGRRNPDIFRYLFGDRFSDAEIEALAEKKEELYRGAARKGVELLPGARKLLDGLQAAGFKQAVGSSAPRKNLDLILQITDTKRYFDVVVSMEDTDRGKPDPQVFLVAAERLGVPPARCVVIEDAVAGVQAAKAGGMAAVAVRGGGHHPAEALRAAGADLVAESLEAVTPAAVRELIERR